MSENQSCIKSRSWSEERSNSMSGGCNGDNCSLEYSESALKRRRSYTHLALRQILVLGHWNVWDTAGKYAIAVVCGPGESYPFFYTYISRPGYTRNKLLRSRACSSVFIPLLSFANGGVSWAAFIANMRRALKLG